MWFKRKTNKPFAAKTFGQYVLRAVSLEDWQAFRAFYLRMLKEQPTSSPESYEEMKDVPPEAWKAMIERALTDSGSLLVGVFYKPSGVLAGVIHLEGLNGSKRAHETEVRLSVLAEEHYNNLLVETCWQEIFAFFEAGGQVKKIKAAVHTNDRATLVAYNALGFHRYGYDDSYYRIGKKYLDAVLMVKTL